MKDDRNLFSVYFQVSKVFLSLHLFSFGCTRLNKSKAQKSLGYPEVITRLPEAEITFEGARAWILQAETNQLVFFQFEAGTDLPAHSHSYAQWGIVVDGEMELTVAGEPRVCRRGDEYLVPARASHSAKFFKPTRVMDFFSEKSRYKPKKPGRSISLDAGY